MNETSPNKAKFQLSETFDKRERFLSMNETMITLRLHRYYIGRFRFRFQNIVLNNLETQYIG